MKVLHVGLVCFCNHLILHFFFLHISSFHYNLISISAHTHSDNYYSANCYIIYDLRREIIGMGKKHANFYLFDLSFEASVCSLVVTPTVRHTRLGHPSVTHLALLHNDLHLSLAFISSSLTHY